MRIDFKRKDYRFFEILGDFIATEFVFEKKGMTAK